VAWLPPVLSSLSRVTGLWRILRQGLISTLKIIGTFFSLIIFRFALFFLGAQTPAQLSISGDFIAKDVYSRTLVSRCEVQYKTIAVSLARLKPFLLFF
jgi:hypothetical protein